ncbi:MAG: hypothetical protein V1804_00455 [Patescibacteria group bacterium]
MDIKVINSAKPDDKPNLDKRDPKKIWIIICPIILLVLVFVMVKLFIINPLSSNKNPLPKQDLKTNLTASKSAVSGAASNQPASTASKINPSPSTPNTNPNPEPPQETPAQPNSETANAEATTPETAEKTTATPSQSDKFILKSLINISEIKKISKFRSCTEAAYGKTSFQDQKESESSLEHYFKLKSSAVSLYAPFDGEIIYASSNKVAIEVRPFNGWIINISGINLKDGLSLNSQVKSGDEIGKSSSSTVKIASSGFSKSQKEEKYGNYSENNLDSFFSHLNDSVNTEFSGKGITTDKIITSKTDRDSKKCDFKPDNDEDWITLK